MQGSGVGGGVVIDCSRLRQFPNPLLALFGPVTKTWRRRALHTRANHVHVKTLVRCWSTEQSIDTVVRRKKLHRIRLWQLYIVSTGRLCFLSDCFGKSSASIRLTILRRVILAEVEFDLRQGRGSVLELWSRVVGHVNVQGSWEYVTLLGCRQTLMVI